MNDNDPPDVIDAEIADTTDIEPRTARTRVVPTGNECWWRLGRTLRDPYRDLDHYGVTDITEHGPGQLTLHLDTTTLDVWSLDHRIAWGFAVNLSGREQHHDPRTLDLLTTWPPQLPKPTPWQQLTVAGDDSHPGDDQRNWRWNDWQPPRTLTGIDTPKELE